MPNGVGGRKWSFAQGFYQKKAFDLVERVRGLRVPVFGKRAPRLGAEQKFGFRLGRKVFAARSKIVFSLKNSAKKDVRSQNSQNFRPRDGQFLINPSACAAGNRRTMVAFGPALTR